MVDKISIWAGRFSSDEALDQYMNLVYVENNDFPFSEFTTSFNITFYDNDFQEAYRSDKSNASVQELAEPLSYADTFIQQIPSSPQRYNSIIAIYNFDYRGNVTTAGTVDFIGVFNYENEL